MQQKIQRWLLIAGAAAGGGWLFALVGLPAAWFLGPMAAAGALACLRGEPARLPTGLTLVAQAMIGSAVSTALTPEALEVFRHYWWGILLIILLLLSISIVNGLLLARFSRMNLATALLGTLPGGAPGMVALSETLGADTRLVAIMQSLRLMLVVATLGLVASLALPLTPSNPAEQLTAADPRWDRYALTIGITALGAWAGLRVHLPAGELVGPALLGTLAGLLGISYAPWPPLILDLAYVVIGVMVGLQFDLQTLRTTGRLLPAFVVSNIALLGSAALIGGGLAYFTRIDLFSAYLATTPGGLNLIAIIAFESRSNVIFILTLHLLRFLIIILAGAPLVRWLTRRLPPNSRIRRKQSAQQCEVFPQK